MSSSSSGPRRRRIAGERKTVTPRTAEEVSTEETTAGETTAAETAATGELDESPPPPPPAASAREDGPEASATSTEKGQRTRRPASPKLMLGTVAAAAVLLLTALALALLVEGAGWGDWKRVQQDDQVTDAIRTAPGAAEQAAATILAYDHESLEADRDAAAALMTPDYREEYVETFDDLVLEAARERKAQVEADVRASGVAAAGPDRVEVLLFVNQTTVSTANSGEPQTALNRVVLAMEKVDGAWRVDDITSY
jgi:Mce-associated membrane protein